MLIIAVFFYNDHVFGARCFLYKRDLRRRAVCFVRLVPVVVREHSSFSLIDVYENALTFF